MNAVGECIAECGKGRRCVDVATGQVAQIKPLTSGRGMVSVL